MFNGWINGLLKSSIYSLIVILLGHKILLYYVPSIYDTVPMWMLWVICGEIFATFFITYYTEGALFAKLKKGYSRIVERSKMENAENVKDLIQTIQYNGRYFIYEYFNNNIRNNKNYSGKQACDFINEEEILKSFPHIELFKVAPNIITSIGLCCTFIAILLGLSGVQVSNDGNIQGIQNLVNNLAGKFSTSIAALLLSIFLNIKASIIFAKIHEIFLKIEQKIDYYFPVQSLAEFMRTDSGFRDLTSEISAQFTQSAQDLTNIIKSDDTAKFLKEGNNLANTLVQSLTDLQKYTQTVENVASQIAKASQSLTTFNKNMANITDISDKLKEIQDNLVQNNKILEENYSKIVEQLPQMGEQFADVCQNMRGNLNGNIDQALIDSLKDTLDAHTQQLKDLFKEHNSNANKNIINMDGVKINKKEVSSNNYDDYNTNLTQDYEKQSNESRDTNINSKISKLDDNNTHNGHDQILDYPTSKIETAEEDQKEKISNSNDDFIKTNENVQVIIDNSDHFNNKEAKLPSRQKEKKGFMDTIFRVFKENNE